MMIKSYYPFACVHVHSGFYAANRIDVHAPSSALGSDWDTCNRVSVYPLCMCDCNVYVSCGVDLLQVEAEVRRPL